MCKTTYDEVKSDYHDQATKVNQVVTDYQKEYQAYLAKVAASGKDVVSSSQVVQQLTIQSEPQAKLEILNQKNISEISRQENQTFNRTEEMGLGFRVESDTNDLSFTAVYSNLKNSTYHGKKIGKIAADVYVVNNNPKFNKTVFDINHDPSYGFYVHNSTVSVNYRFYYEDGTQVNFDKGTAYLAVASLNNYNNWRASFGVETVEVVSGGQAIGLYESSVTVHGNKLYSDKANSFDANGHSLAVLEWGNLSSDDVVSNAKEITDTNIPDDWDTKNSSNRYYGAGLIALDGKELSIKMYVQNDLAPANLSRSNEYTGSWNGMWYNMGTIIPETPGIPNKPTVSYNYSTVAANRLISRKTSR